MRYTATIKWIDNGDIREDMVLKIGKVEDDDDEIFYYLEDEQEIEHLKKEGRNEFVILSIKQEITLDEFADRMGISITHL